MALPDEQVVQVGTQIVFADHAGDFSPAAKTSLVQGTPLEVQFSFASVVDGAGRESAQFDYGVSRAPAYSYSGALEFAASGLTAGSVVGFYIAPSPDSTAANGNPMQIDGVDAAAPSGIGTLAELLKASQFIGNFKVTDDATTNVQVSFIGIHVPTERFGILIGVDESGAAMHSDDVEMHIVASPLKSVLID